MDRQYELKDPGGRVVHVGETCSCFQYLTDVHGFVFMSDAQAAGFRMTPRRRFVLVVDRGKTPL